MANINKISVNGEVYDINPAWVSATDGGLVLNADKVRGMTVRGKVMNTFANKFGELQEIKRKFEKKRIRDINWFKTTINNQVRQ